MNIEEKIREHASAAGPRRPTLYAVSPLDFAGVARRLTVRVKRDPGNAEYIELWLNTDEHPVIVRPDPDVPNGVFAAIAPELASSVDGLLTALLGEAHRALAQRDYCDGCQLVRAYIDLKASTGR